MQKKIIDNSWISLEEIDGMLDQDVQLELHPEVRDKIASCRDYLDQKIAGSDRLIYGVNTGFGSLCNTAISENDLGQLQKNLVFSHACGMGEEVPTEIVRRMLLLKILGLSHGHSGVQVATVERLIFFFNEKICPVVYQQGSLGASGDLAPLAHLVLPLLGEGEVRINGERIHSGELAQKYGVEPIELRSKEGLALLNGTQFMSAFASHGVSHGKRLLKQFNLIGALSLEAYDGRKEPFQANVNGIRNQKGQISVAEEMREILSGSELIERNKVHVQDPYSFRCIPQVHGASMDALSYCEEIVNREVNAVTDNPTIFPEEDDVVSAGNFHGQPLALAMDFLAIALAELGSISERRVYKLISGTRDLPAFLVAHPGLNSGFMIPQYTAASIVSQNKQLCHPASVDTIDSSNGQEDHVSMGANGATKLYRVIENCYAIQGIELLNAAQAIEFRRPAKSSPKLEKLLADYRKYVSFVQDDCYMHPEMKKSAVYVKERLCQI
ncbi:MAG: histidine ammonia-lyase [Bacteroidetes bacterium]|nr:MAG: histidine ammonia-lyase [Bacteroidota bacterium]